jgi:hypothetical protein
VEQPRVNATGTGNEKCLTLTVPIKGTFNNGFFHPNRCRLARHESKYLTDFGTRALLLSSMD